jgi:hypothetical protein
VVDGKLYIGNNDWNIYCFTSSSNSGGASNQGNVDNYVYALVGVAVVVVVVAVVYIYSRPRKTEE